MSSFSRQSDPIPIPFDPDHSVVVRSLTGRECDIAREAHRSGLAGGSARLWPAVLRRALERGASDPDVMAALADPLIGWDRFALVRLGLVSWTYPEQARPVDAKKAVGKTPAVEAYDPTDVLDDERLDFIATQVLRTTKPTLFAVSKEDVETERKNDSSASIAP